MGIKEDAEALGEDPEVRRKAIEALPPFDPNSYVIIDIPVHPKNSPPPRGGFGDKKPSPADKNPSPASQGTPPSAPPPGAKAVQNIEKNFSGEQDTDGVCVKCIARGLATGAAWAAGIGLFVALLPIELAAAVLTALVLVSMKALMDLGDNWGNMSSHEKQETVAEIVGGAAVGRFAPEPGSLAPKGWGSFTPKGRFGPSPVLETPEGFRMPVPEAEPTGPTSAGRPMEMGGPDEAAGGGGDQGGDPPPKKKLSAKERRERDAQRTADEKFKKRGETNNISRNNQAQNEQFAECARGLNDDQWQKLHEAVTKQNMGPDDIIATRNSMFPDNPYPGPRR
jgi:hypothetical protein